MSWMRGYTYQIEPKKRRRKRWLTLAMIVVVVIFAYSHLSTHINYAWKSTQPATGMDPNFMMIVNDCFLPTAKAVGYDLRITAGFRSLAEQKAIYDQGRTENGDIVSEAPPGHSLHNYGYAVDVADETAGYKLDWQKLVRIGAYCGLESGGDGDLPHFEYRGGLTTDQFLAGMRPPPLTLPCPVMAERAKAGKALTMADLKACGAPKF